MYPPIKTRGQLNKFIYHPSHIKSTFDGDTTGNKPMFNLCYFLAFRVEMQKMKVIRPSSNVAKYTMIFHTRDRGNEANGQR